MQAHFIILITIFFVSNSAEDVRCPKPEELEIKEAFCYRNNVELIDRIYETSSSFLNFAKKKLGMGVIDDEKVPEKCEYYQCILQELRMLNSQKYPIYEVIKTWIEEHVVLSQGMDLLQRLNVCNDVLANATANNLKFNGDLTMGEYAVEENTDMIRKCEMNAQFLRCLSLQKGCPLFKYP